MSFFLQCLTLLTLIGLSSCSIARHGRLSGGVPTTDSRINWPRPQPAGRYDGTYSTHNYKHPNKAAQAHRLTGGEGIRVSYPQPGLAHRANYKTPMPGLLPVGGVVINHRLATDFAGGNYKMPRPVVLTGLTKAAPAPAPTPAKPLETLNRLPSPAASPAHAPINPIN